MCRSEGRCPLQITSPKEHSPPKIALLPTESRKVSKIFFMQKLFQNKFTSMGSVHLSSPRLLIAFFFFSFQVCIILLRVAPTIYLSLFFPSFFSFIILSPPLFSPLCVWLLGLIRSLLPPTARSLLQPRCFYTNFSVQLSY